MGTQVSAGLERAQGGKIVYPGTDVTTLPAKEIVRRDVVIVPEGRLIFPDMTVLENLKIGAFLRRDKQIASDIERMYTLFPRLKERSWQMANTFSGGKQQVLAVTRALMSRPKLLMMDEPSLGLAPLVVKGIFSIIRQIRDDGITVLLIEQNATAALHIADYAYVLSTGEIVLEGKSAELLSNPEVQAAYLGA